MTQTYTFSRGAQAPAAGYTYRGTKTEDLGPILFFLRKVTTTAGGMMTARRARKTRSARMILDRRRWRQRRLTCFSGSMADNDSAGYSAAQLAWDNFRMNEGRKGSITFSRINRTSQTRGIHGFSKASAMGREFGL